MKVEIGVSQLMECAQVAAKFTSPSGLMPVFRNIAFTGSKIMAFNGSAGILYETDCDFGDLPFTLNAANLLQVLKRVSPSATVKLDISEAKVIIRIGKFRATFPSSSFVEITNVHKLLPTGPKELSTSVFNAIDAAAWSASSDGTLPYLDGVEITDKYIYATDARRVSRVKYSGSGYTGFLPSSLYSVCLSDGKKSGGQVAENDSLVVLTVENMVLFSTKIIGKRPDFSAAFDKLAQQRMHGVVLDVDPELLVDAVKRVSLFSGSELGNFVQLSVKDNVLSVTSVGLDRNSAAAEEALELESPVTQDISVTLFVPYLLDALKVFFVFLIVPEDGGVDDFVPWGAYFHDEDNTHFCPIMKL